MTPNQLKEENERLKFELEIEQRKNVLLPDKYREVMSELNQLEDKYYYLEDENQKLKEALSVASIALKYYMDSVIYDPSLENPDGGHYYVEHWTTVAKEARTRIAEILGEK